MTSRYVPYATTPTRLLGQLISDMVVIAWTTLWVLVGMAVHAAVSTIADVGRQVETGANGVSDNLNSAGDRTDDFPLIGDALSKPLRAASDAALDIAGAGHSLDTTASWLACRWPSSRPSIPTLSARGGARTPSRSKAWPRWNCARPASAAAGSLRFRRDF
jgi:hypothetical protein